ncbi:MAG: hypothetical protein V4497_02325 [Bacteroidota bacterium]
MKRILINITSNLTNVPNLDEMVAKEFARGKELAEQGIEEDIFTKDDFTGAILIFKGVDLEKAKELIATFPLFPYFTNVDYKEVTKHS